MHDWGYYKCYSKRQSKQKKNDAKLEKCKFHQITAGMKKYRVIAGMSSKINRMIAQNNEF